jgi:DNA-binding NarL/FixJ family response regulator
VREALTGGAKGFVEKGASIAVLTHALNAVASGGVYFGPAVARTVDALVRTQWTASNALSDREREVLAALAEGLPSKAIAVRLNISLKTVNNHRAHIAEKTGLHSIAQLTMHAVRIGLIPGPGDEAEPAAEFSSATPQVAVGGPAGSVRI